MRRRGDVLVLVILFCLLVTPVLGETSYVCYSVHDFQEIETFFLNEDNDYTHEFEGRATIAQEGGTGALVANYMDFSCGLCEDADFTDVVHELSAPGDNVSWCDYEPVVMEGMIEDSEVICARSAFSGRKWELEFTSWASPEGCYDPGNAMCTTGGGVSSFYGILYSGGCDFETIQEAIDAANPGDVIQVWPGTYPEALVIDKPVKIRGANPETTIIEPPSGSAITVVKGGTSLSNPLLISGLTLTGVQHDAGPPYLTPAFNILLNDTAEHNILLDNIVIRDNQGWGLAARAANPAAALVLYIEGSVFHNNTVGLGIPVADGSLDGFSDDFFIDMTLSNLSVTQNYPLGMNVSSSVDSLLLSRSRIEDNSGHGVFLHGGKDILIQDSVFSGNGWATDLYGSQFPSGLRIACDVGQTCDDIVVFDSRFSQNGLGANTSNTSTGYGVFATAHPELSLLLLSNTFVENADDDILLGGEISAAVYRSTFSGSGGFAINAEAPEALGLDNASVDARENFWGHYTGPSGAFPGRGVPVAASVTVPNWYWTSLMERLVTPAMAYTYDWLSFDAIKWRNTESQFVRDDLALIHYGNGSAAISWNSSSTAIDGNGRVHPGPQPIEVTLTASIQDFFMEPLEKEIVVSVPPDLHTDQEAVELVAASIDFNTISLENPGPENVTTDLNLSTRGPYRTRISWTSDGDVTPSGAVIRTEEDQNVTLTATVSRNAAVAMRTIALIVPGIDDPDMLALMGAKRALTDSLVRNGNPEQLRAAIYAPRLLEGHEPTISWESSSAAVNFSFQQLPIEESANLGSGVLVVDDEQKTLLGDELDFSWGYCEEASSWQDRLGPADSLSALLGQQVSVCVEDSQSEHFDLYVSSVGDGVTCIGLDGMCEAADDETSVLWRTGSDSPRPVMRSRTPQEVELIASLSFENRSIERRFFFETAMAEAPAVVVESGGFSAEELVESFLSDLEVEVSEPGNSSQELIPELTEEELQNFTFVEPVDLTPVGGGYQTAGNGSMIVLPSGEVIMLENASSILIAEGEVHSGVADELLLTPEVRDMARWIRLPSDESELYLYFPDLIAGSVVAKYLGLILPSGHTVDFGNATISGGRLWNGLFLAPRLMPVGQYDVPEGKVAIVLEVGGVDRSFSLSEPATITLRGYGGYLGAMSDGESMLSPIRECGSPINPPCSYTVGDDLVIRSDHFSVFGAYSVDDIEASSVGGGGEGDVPEITESVEEQSLLESWFQPKRGAPPKRGVFGGEGTARLTLFDLGLTLTDNILFFGERLFAVFTLINVGDPGEIPAKLKYTISDAAGEIQFLESEAVSVETQRDIFRSFDVSNLPVGDYILTVSLNYEGQVDPAMSQQSFSIVGQSLMNWSNIALFLVVIMISVLVYLGVVRRQMFMKQASEEPEEASPQVSQAVPYPAEGGFKVFSDGVPVESIGPFTLHVGGTHSFFLADGRELHSLHELREALISMERSLFEKHVTQRRNDFADWVEKIFEAPELALKMRRLHTRVEMAELLRVSAGNRKPGS